MRSAALFVALALAACVPERQAWENTFDGDGEDLFVLDDDLTCLGDDTWTEIDGTRIANPLGHRDEAEEIARGREPGVFPVGTIISLLPDEVMVKRGNGFDVDTFDWEFLKLDTASGRTVITARGTTEMANPGGSCLSCHEVAGDFDLVCFTNALCAPLPFFIDIDIDPAVEDARCR